MDQIYHPPALSDYVLGLLTPQDKLRVEQHIAHCGRCRQLVEQERQIAVAVRETLTAVTLPSKSRLHQLMPEIPHRYQPLRLTDNSWWQPLTANLSVLKPLAVTAAVVMLFFSSISLGTTPYTAVAATMTATSTTQPTATLAQPIEEAPTAHPTMRPDEQDPPSLATPIAQLAPQPNNN